MGRIDPETLLSRATGGTPLRPDETFEASLAGLLLEDPWSLWCRYHAPRDKAIDQLSRFERLVRRWNGELEHAWIRRNHPDAVEIHSGEPEAAVRETLAALRSGAPEIGKARLWDAAGGVCGTADLLLRDSSVPSDLGPWHYRVRAVRRSRRARPAEVAEAVLLSRILGRLQGHEPETAELVLSWGVARERVSDHDQTCSRILEEWEAIRSGARRPTMPGIGEAASPWRAWTDAMLRESGDLTLVPVLSASAREKLRLRAGVERPWQLDALGEEAFAAALGEKAGPAVHRKLAAWRTGRPVFNPEVPLAVPRRDRLVYFDFETSMGCHPSLRSHVFMIGACRADGTHRTFTARGPKDEGRMFEDFLDWVGDPADATLYHWTSFEVRRMAEVARRWPRLAARLRALTGSCVDLKETIKRSVLFGTRTYSIKQVGPFLGFHWRQADVDAEEALVLYWEWLEDGDPEKIRKVAMYNEDDCRAMIHVDRALQAIACTVAPKPGV